MGVNIWELLGLSLSSLHLLLILIPRHLFRHLLVLLCQRLSFQRIQWRKMKMRKKRRLKLEENLQQPELEQISTFGNLSKNCSSSLKTMETTFTGLIDKKESLRLSTQSRLPHFGEKGKTALP